jgi:hypothetical protein
VVSPDDKDEKQITKSLANPVIWRNSIVTGIAFKYVNITAYQDFFNEYLNGTDLTENPRLYPITKLFGVVPVPGTNQFGTPAVAYSGYFRMLNRAPSMRPHSKRVFFSSMISNLMINGGSSTVPGSIPSLMR